MLDLHPHKRQEVAHPERVEDGQTIAEAVVRHPHVDVTATGARLPNARPEDGGDDEDYRRQELDGQFVDVSKKIKSAHQDAQMKRSLFYLDGGRRYVPLAFSKLDMDFLGAAQFNAEKLCALMRTPDDGDGRMVNTTFNNVAGEQKRFWSTTVMSDLDLMIEVLNHDLVFRDFGADIRIWPDTSNIPELVKITHEKTKMAVDLGKLGVPMKEINRALQIGLQEYEGWEEPVGGLVGAKSAKQTPSDV